VPVVSEDPIHHHPYPTIYSSSEDSGWSSDTSTATPYQERNIFETHYPEGTYIETAKVIQTYTKPKEEDLAPSSGNSIKISEIFRFNRNFQIRLEDNRPAPIKSIKVKGGYISNLPNIIKYIKIRYQEWLFAGGELSGHKFFVDLWDPKALEAFADPNKDLHPGAQLLRDWNKLKEEKENRRPIPKRKRGRNNPLNWH